MAGTIYIRFLIYVTAIYEQKNERNWFFNSCHEIKVLVDFSWPSLLNCLPTVVLFSSENHFLKPPRRSSLNLFSRTDMLRNKRPRCLVNGSSVCAIANGYQSELKGPCGFRPYYFYSKLKIENQKFTIVSFNVWFLKNWKSQIYNLNCQFLFLRNI